MVCKSVTLVALALGVFFGGACTTVRRIQPAAYLADNSPEIVWVTYSDNTVVRVAEPVILRDTLRGKEPGRRERVKIPLHQIQSVHAKVPDHTKTALLITTLGVAALSSLYVAFISQVGPNGDGTNCGVDHNGDQIQDC